jgi:hypothetical protein
MSTRTDPREWYRQEELARQRYQRKMRRARSSRQLNVLYVAAVILGIAVLYLLTMALGYQPPFGS